MCGSPRSLPRAPNCDMGPPHLGRGQEAASPVLAPLLYPHLPTHTIAPLPVPPPATLAFKALDVRDPEPLS